MQSITVKNIPHGVHQSLKNMAKLNHRSLNNEIICCLERYTKMSGVDSEALISKARRIRSEIDRTFTHEEIQIAKDAGRK